MNWYRAGSPSPPLAAMDDRCAQENDVTNSAEKGKESLRPHSDEYISSIEKDLSICDEENSTVLSYQSLADIIPPSSQPVLPPAASSYGTVAERSIQRDTATKDATHKLLQFPLLRSSDRLANAVLEAFELAEELASGKATFYLFMLYLLRIWQVLFLCAESLISIRRRPPLPPFYKQPRPSSNDDMV